MAYVITISRQPDAEAIIIPGDVTHGVIVDDLVDGLTMMLDAAKRRRKECELKRLLTIPYERIQNGEKEEGDKEKAKQEETGKKDSAKILGEPHLGRSFKIEWTRD